MFIACNTNNGIALAGNEGDSSTSNVPPRSESDSWCLTVPEGKSATIHAVLGADDLASLSVTDEDGVTTTYGYNAAHQLEEVIREEILEDGVVITPETLTTYTRDAAGRVLTERKDIGAMITIETTQYDLLGREISRTDILNRTTTTAYSTDGLTSAMTHSRRGYAHHHPPCRWLACGRGRYRAACAGV